jgi:hypothetical protein
LLSAMIMQLWEKMLLLDSELPLGVVFIELRKQFLFSSMIPRFLLKEWGVRRLPSSSTIPHEGKWGGTLCATSPNRYFHTWFMCGGGGSTSEGDRGSRGGTCWSLIWRSGPGNRRIVAKRTGPYTNWA